VDVFSKTTLKSLLPGGVLLLAVATLLEADWLTLALATLTFLYFASLVVGLLLAWRFHSSRVFFALIVVLLGQQAIAVFSSGHTPPLVGPGGTALRAVFLLLPLNFVLLSLERERGFTKSGLTARTLFLFVQCVVVGVLGRLGESSVVSPARSLRHAGPTLTLPGYLWFTLAAATMALLIRFFLFRKPVEGALLWSLAAYFLGVHAGGMGRSATAYFAAASIILGVSIVETSYVLAYHDELTGLPSRRAFNDALLRLQAPYSIAMVDIDHFKKFNDTYGHDTGDEVLRLVASKLARVGGGGQAYRCGGEEFAVLFSGRTSDQVADDVEQLRATIEGATFRMRTGDRRQAPRGADRRNQRIRGRVQTGHAIRQLAKSPTRDNETLSVTVSIGLATSVREGPYANHVLLAADKALYRAKAAGRNRVEIAVPSRRRQRSQTAGIA
jgi:GGDEF domain-containing protein